MSQKFVTNGGISIPSSQELELAGYSIGEISNDSTLASPSSAALPTELAVKTYVDAQLGASDIDLKLDGDAQTSIDQDTGKLGFASTANEIEIAYAHDGTDGVFTIGLPDDVTIGQHLTVSGNLSAGADSLYIAGTQVTATAAELNYLDDDNLTAADLTKLAGVDSTADELNIVDGDTTATSTTVETGDRVVYNDGGTMVQVDVDDIDTYFSGTSMTLTNKTMTDPDLNNPDIDGGTIDGATIATSDITITAANSATFAGANVDMDVSAGSLTTSSAQDLAILKSGAAANDADIDFGAFEVIAQTFESDIADGTAPFTVASTTVVSNLNADKVDGCDVVDEDDMASDSDSSVPTQQSVKKYVDDQLGSSALSASIGSDDYSLDLDSESISFAGTANEVDVSSAEDSEGNVTVTYGLPTDVDIAGDLTPITFTMAEFTVDASGNTDIDGTLNVEGESTFGNTINMGTNSIEGSADEMVISADGDDTSVSGSASGSLSLNANGGIFTDDAVDMDSTLNVEGEVTMQAAATVGTTLGVTGVGTFTAQSVHSSGLQTGGNIVSDTDATDSLGSAAIRWANVHSDEFEMSNSAKKDLSVAMNGTALEVVSFADADFDTAKIVVKVSDGTNMTAQEVLVASVDGSCKIVEYAKVSIGTEISMTWAASSDGTDTSITCNAASGTLKGSYDLLKA